MPKFTVYYTASREMNSEITDYYAIIAVFKSFAPSLYISLCKM